MTTTIPKEPRNAYLETSNKSDISCEVEEYFVSPRNAAKTNNGSNVKSRNLLSLKIFLSYKKRNPNMASATKKPYLVITEKIVNKLPRIKSLSFLSLYQDQKK